MATTLQHDSDSRPPEGKAWDVIPILWEGKEAEHETIYVHVASETEIPAVMATGAEFCVISGFLQKSVNIVAWNPMTGIQHLACESISMLLEKNGE